MKLNQYLFLLLFVCMSNGIAQTKDNDPIHVGFLGAGLEKEEAMAVRRFLSEREQFRTTYIKDDIIREKEIKNEDYTHLWIHQMEKNHGVYNDKATGDKIKTFVKNGGHLILSMEAVRLLNEWGIEKNAYQIENDTVTDDGFGRPLGFHGFKSHPIFDGMHGGSYPWKSKEDHIVRKVGFFGNQLPDTTIAKVLGVEWTYITFHEDNKLVMEYRLGKGSIIAVGAFTYFAKENYNRAQLNKFYENILEYTAGNIKEVKANNWDYSPQKVVGFTKGLPTIDAPVATEWSLPQASIALKKEKASDDVVILTGRRMMAVGKQKGGLDEIWTNPFMSFRDVITGVKLKGQKSIVWLNDLTPSITSSPELLVREYELGPGSLKEIVTVSPDNPVAVIHYEWESSEIEKIVLTYTSNFRYMWPYSERVASTIRYTWSPEMNAAVATAQSNTLVSIMGFSNSPENSVMGQYDGFVFKDNGASGIKTENKQVSGFFSFDAQKMNGKLSAYLTADEQGLDKAGDMYAESIKDFEFLYKKASQYYNNLLKSSLMLTTPDKKFNEGYRWALLHSDQFFQETPSIGTTMVAGLGTTERGWDGGQKISGRPGYSWYFGRDGQWCAFAVNAYGGHEQVKKMLKVFAKYQSLNGKIYHELTTSGAVHYDASDATPLYVVLAAHYLKYSGDVAFIKEIWPSIKRAMDFCYSTDTDGDGLIEITDVGHGWIEGGALFGTHTEVYLAGCWAAALDAASYMASTVEEPGLASSYASDAKEVKRSIDDDFWDSEKEYFYVGKMKDGSFMEEESVLSGVPIYLDAVTDSDKAMKTAKSFASNFYSTDWGVRILPENSKKFHPGSYHSGMVWPLFGGWASLAEYKTGNYASAYNHIMSNLLIYEDWNLGGVEETLNGSEYKPAGVCSQQGWSETMVLQPIYEGMLGLSPDALNHSVSLEPNFPWNWNKVKVENIKFGDHNINFRLDKTDKSTTYHFWSTGGSRATLNFSTSLPLGTIIEKVTIDGKQTEYTTEKGAESIKVKFSPIAIADAVEVNIVHKKGIGALPIINDPKPGDKNVGAKLIGQNLSDKTFVVEVEGIPGHTYQFKVMSNMKIKKITNAVVLSKERNEYMLEFSIPDSSKKYERQQILFNLK
ncbi:hypothetical protein J8L85_05075 [Maribacter sp. MMG018]|uniref:MGH1-like glycoside hydrolase domain-containing protein n=1 Tax=Maribacter sp. MMG018 TaxID=2822688 RepID=UPI001B36903B|nr:GH116 family glycosyl hydrolase [Maribacter sp. MMG018]MBQ4913798.1 hypothetical protein [Maribacter sp. MMG018]